MHSKKPAGSIARGKSMEGREKDASRLPFIKISRVAIQVRKQELADVHAYVPYLDEMMTVTYMLALYGANGLMWCTGLAKPFRFHFSTF
jgi:hypothetical protein